MDEPVTIDPLLRVRELIREAETLAFSEGVPLGKNRFLRFVEDAGTFVRAFEDKFPPIVAEIGSLSWTSARIGAEEEVDCSANAFRSDDEGSDVLLDFNYAAFKRAAQILCAAEVRLLAEIQSPSVTHSQTQTQPSAERQSDSVKESRPRKIPRETELATWPGLLNEMQVAGVIDMKPATLQKWRMFRKGDSYRGPKFFKVGRSVRYSPTDVLDYLIRMRSGKS